MSSKYVGAGKTIQHTPSGADVAAGTVVAKSHTLGIADADIADGVAGELQIEGRWTVPKVSAAVFVVGEKLLWDASAGAFDDSAATPASGDIMGAAIAAKAGANGETTCEVIFTPGNATLTA